MVGTSDLPCVEGALACKMSTEMIIVGMQAFPVKLSLSMIESDITEQINETFPPSLLLCLSYL